MTLTWDRTVGQVKIKRLQNVGSSLVVNQGNSAHLKPSGQGWVVWGLHWNCFCVQFGLFDRITNRAAKGYHKSSICVEKIFGNWALSLTWFKNSHPRTSHLTIIIYSYRLQLSVTLLSSLCLDDKVADPYTCDEHCLNPSGKKTYLPPQKKNPE